LDEHHWPLLTSRNVSAGDLIAKLSPQLFMAEASNADAFTLSLTAYHAQRLDVSEFLLEDSPAADLGSDSFVPLRSGHWVLAPPIGKNPQTLLLGSAEDFDVKEIALDLEWRDSGNEMLLRINKARVRIA
jgi:hypothetical protein